MHDKKSQISIETIVLLFAIILIALISIFLMFKLFPDNSNTYSQSITIFRASVSPKSLTLFLSGKIGDPKSILLTYSKQSNISASNTISLSDCDYFSNYSISVFSYTFLNSSDCNFSVFNGPYFITKATYFNGENTMAFFIKSPIKFGYNVNKTGLYAVVSTYPAIATIGTLTTAYIKTNIYNSSYSLFLGKYVVKKCLGIPSSFGCSFILNSSIGIYNSSSFYQLKAYVYNSSENYEASTSIYITNS